MYFMGLPMSSSCRFARFLPVPSFKRRWTGMGMVLLAGAALCAAEGADDPADSESERGSAAEILRTHDIRARPENRDAAVQALRARSLERHAAAQQRARALKMPLREARPDGTVREIEDLDSSGNPLYRITHNANAALSTGAHSLQAAPYALSGTGVIIGMWDGGSGLPTHREFSTGRMVNKDSAGSIGHATHVGGTLVASGVTASAKGMAPAATVYSYDWNNDLSEMAALGATGPGQTQKIYLSNHSYGYLAGWYRTGGSSPAYIWYGSGTTSAGVDPEFGQYNAYARDMDALAYTTPYYLIFRSAGNDRTDNPGAGQIVQLSANNTATVAYAASSHPAGDGAYRNGYDTISYEAVAKNVITIGSVTDAVTAGARDVTQASISSFSSWGPTDDGRIKPDLVANGESLYSPLNTGNASYGTMSGTSMSTPNATGTAALLVEKYSQLFSGGAMRASSLKGLLIHTADDLGTPGPDYAYGWGLLDGARAADLLASHAAEPKKKRLTEGVLSSSVPRVAFDFVWDGHTPIRATLCWTDPAGTATSTEDLRSARLRNNLDVRIIGPNQEIFRPFVMPFVGDWSTNSLSAAATTGVNNTDNIEQVLIATPPSGGVYRVEVTYQGTLTDGYQQFSLLLDGSSGEDPPPAPLSITAVSPAFAYSGSSVSISITGSGLDRVTQVKLTRSGLTSISATSVQMNGDQLQCSLNLAGAAAGAWNVEISAGADRATWSGGFSVSGIWWSENFDGTVSGWTSEAVANQTGNQWALSSSPVYSTPRAYFIPESSAKTTTALVSPALPVPAGAANLELRFRHSYNLQSKLDGGRLEYRVNEGSWVGAGDTGSGTEFTANGYPLTMQETGLVENRSYYAGLPAWTGNSGGFVESVVKLTDTARFAGKNVQFRWVLGANYSLSGLTSPGWTVDSIALWASGDLTNQSPNIQTSAHVPGAETLVLNPSTPQEQTAFLVRSVSAGLAVTATDDGGSEALTYTWNAQGPASVFFQPNATTGNASTTADFQAAGDYAISVTVKDASGLSATSQATVRVLAVPSALRVEPATTSLRVGETLAFSASVLDQFNELAAGQPSSFNWSATGGGTVDSSGLFSATTAGERFSVAATANVSGADVSSYSLVTVLPATAEVVLSDLSVPYTGSPRGATVTTQPKGLSVIVRYNGSSTLPVSVGSYSVEASISDPNYQGSATNTFEIVSNDLAVFTQWEADKNLSDTAAGADADPDGDGMTNWMEWRFDFNPKDPESRLKMELVRNEGGWALQINRVITQGALKISRSTDLLHWSDPETIVIPQRQDNFTKPLSTSGDTPPSFYRLWYTDASP